MVINQHEKKDAQYSRINTDALQRKLSFPLYQSVYDYGEQEKIEQRRQARKFFTGQYQINAKPQKKDYYRPASYPGNTIPSKNTKKYTCPPSVLRSGAGCSAQ